MRNLYLILVLAASLLSFATAQAAPADLPETGQTTCYAAAGGAIDCANTGQDGEHRAGAAWPNPRFVVNECGTPAVTSDDVVTDNLTGLMWMRSLELVPVSWTTALAAVDGFTLCGFSDWRLPNINELESLVNDGEAANQATLAAFLSTQGFGGVQADTYWSSSSVAGGTGSAWTIDMWDGVVNTGPKSANRYVWPVRAGQ